jgi:hypothetical protein
VCVCVLFVCERFCAMFYQQHHLFLASTMQPCFFPGVLVVCSCVNSLVANRFHMHAL